MNFRYGEPVRLEAHRLVFPVKNLTIDLSCVNHENTFSVGLRLASPEERKQRVTMVESNYLNDHRLPEKAEQLFSELLNAVNYGNSSASEKLLSEIIGLGQGLSALISFVRKTLI